MIENLISQMRMAVPLLARRSLPAIQVSLWRSAGRFGTWLAILFGLAAGAQATQLDDLNGKLDTINSQADTISSQTAKLAIDVPTALSLIRNQLDHGTLLVGDYVEGVAGSSVTLPFLFAPSTFPVTDIQADIIVPSQLSVLSVTAGACATASQKTVSANLVNGAERFIVIGLNQNIIGEGEIVLMSFKIPINTPSGLYPIVIDNPVASDANGQMLLMSVMSGIVEVK